MQLSERRRSDCGRLTADPAGRMHRERVHGKCGKGKTGPYAVCRDAGACPAIRYRNRQEGTSGTVKPVSYRRHPHYTGDIHYAFSEEFIERNSRFGDGCRDVCVDALNRLSGRCARLLFSRLGAGMYEFHFGIDRLRKQTAEEKQKNKLRTRNFWFRVKGMDRYGIPKGERSVFSTDVAGDPRCRAARVHFNKTLGMTDGYTGGDSREYIRGFVNKCVGGGGRKTD